MARFVPSMLRCGDCSSLLPPLVLYGGSPASGVAQAGNKERGQNELPSEPPARAATVVGVRGARVPLALPARRWRGVECALYEECLRAFDGADVARPRRSR